MKYDDASWHYGGTFPSDLPPGAGATHIGFFVAWCLLSGLSGDIHIKDFPDGLAALRNREITPGAFLLQHCDEKFTSEDLDSTGNAFAVAYYEQESGGYLADYETTFMRPALFRRQPPSLYHVSDTWKNFDRLRLVLDKRFSAWRSGDG